MAVRTVRWSIQEAVVGADTWVMPSPQLSLFAADRYHDPRIAADRSRARALAMLRPYRKCERAATSPHRSSAEGAGKVLQSKVPHSTLSASQTSPTVTPIRSASRMAGSRLSDERATSSTRDTAASQAA